MSEIVRAKGVNGELELDNDQLTIIRKGAMAFLTHGMKGDKSILISNISSVQFKNGSARMQRFRGQYT